jgi:SAM-dependent methyltransferase
MGESASEEQIRAASAYEELFVPALFQDWAPRVSSAAFLTSSQRVLDVACGTGVLARQAYAIVGKDGVVAGLDANAGMLAVAKTLSPNVQWHLGIAEALPFSGNSFDAVVSQFGLMFFTDRVQAVTEMLRVLRHGGRLAVATWGALDSMPAYAIEVSLLERLAGNLAADALRAPFVLGEPAALEEIGTKAGVNSIKVTTSSGTARFPSIRKMVEADLRGWLPVMGVALPENKIHEILEGAEEDLKPFALPSGHIAFDTKAHIMTGVKS